MSNPPGIQSNKRKRPEEEQFHESAAELGYDGAEDEVADLWQMMKGVPKQDSVLQLAALKQCIEGLRLDTLVSDVVSSSSVLSPLPGYEDTDDEDGSRVIDALALVEGSMVELAKTVTRLQSAVEATLKQASEEKAKQWTAHLNRLGSCHICEVKEGRELIACKCLQQPEENIVSEGRGIRVCTPCLAIGRSFMGPREVDACSLCKVISCGPKCVTQIAEVQKYAPTREMFPWRHFTPGRAKAEESSESCASCNQDIDRKCDQICSGCVSTAVDSFGSQRMFSPCASAGCKTLLVSKLHFRCIQSCISDQSIEQEKPWLRLEDNILQNVLEFCPTVDLSNVSLTCLRLHLASEITARRIVERANVMFKTGPVVIHDRDESWEDWDGWPGYQSSERRLFLEGTHPSPISVPKDGKTWVGVLRLLVKVTKYSFSFTFQKEGFDAADRFLRLEDKLCFTKTNQCPKGVVFGPQLFGKAGVKASRFVALCNSRPLEEGVYRVIGKFFASKFRDSPFQVGLVHCDYDITRKEELFGRSKERSWAAKFAFDQEPWTNDGDRAIRNGEATFGMEFDASKKTLTMYTTDHWTGMNWNGKMCETQEVKFVGDTGPLWWAASIEAEGIRDKHAAFSVRECSKDEWEQFLRYHKKEVDKMVEAQDEHEGQREEFEDRYPNRDYDEWGGEFGY